MKTLRKLLGLLATEGGKQGILLLIFLTGIFLVLAQRPILGSELAAVAVAHLVLHKPLKR
jgi:hypothetical protein